MATYFGIDSNYASTLFSSLGTTSGASSLTGLLSEYSSIKSGAYKGLLQKYYGTQKTTGTQQASETRNTNDTKKTENSVKDPTSYTRAKASTSTSKDTTKTLSGIDKSTDALKESADALISVGSKSVFAKKTTTDAEGNTTKVYDTDKILGAVKDFVKNYNAVLADAAGSKSSTITSDMESLERTTGSNAALLKSVGITADEDGKLSVDETKFKASEMSSVKTLFNGTGSYAYQVSAKASMMNYHAGNEASRANTYTSGASYANNFSSGDLFNSLF